MERSLVNNQQYIKVVFAGVAGRRASQAQPADATSIPGLAAAGRGSEGV
jgi:hypothetical protein